MFLQGQVSWEPDLWGNIRRQVESQRATAQATAADLANVDLSLRSELALDYFELRGLDTQQRLLDNTVQQYEQYLELTKVRFVGGWPPTPMWPWRKPNLTRRAPRPLM